VSLDLLDLDEEVRAAWQRRIIRSERFAALYLLHTWSSLPRVRKCGRARAKGHEHVGVGLADGRASVQGLQRCASVHVCPWCAPKIRDGRATEIRQAVDAHLAEGGGVVFVTATVPHRHGQSLRGLWDALSGAWGDLAASEWWRTLGQHRGIALTTTRRKHHDWCSRPKSAGKASCDCPSTSSTTRKVGVVRAFDCTVGSNGWHPHLHNLLFLDRPLDGDDLDDLGRVLGGQWCSAVVGRGLPATHKGAGLVVEAVTDGDSLAQYLAGVDGRKVDLELARPDLKRARRGNRTPWQVLRDIVDHGDRADLDLWWEYEQASKGRNAVTWTHGLKAKFGVGEVSDDELAAAEVGHRTVYEFHGPSWARLVAAKLIAPLLSNVEVGNHQGVLDVLDLAAIDHGSVVYRGPP
jgi:hypothetical protein